MSCEWQKTDEKSERMGSMRYNNKFFQTEEEAKAFKKARGGGVLLNWNPKGHKSKKLEFLSECVVALDARMEAINPDETPWCVAWNEKE